VLDTIDDQILALQLHFPLVQLGPYGVVNLSPLGQVMLRIAVDNMQVLCRAVVLRLTGWVDHHCAWSVKLALRNATFKKKELAIGARTCPDNLRTWAPSAVSL
jgi:hypothetical protein